MVNINKIGIIALSGEYEKEKTDNAVQLLKSAGYRVELSSNIYDTNRYLAGTDSDKINALHKFFKDKNIDIILNLRGGYGAIRLLDKIDYELIKSNPKPICGYSDTTALLLMIYKKTGLVTYHSPMICNINKNNPVIPDIIKTIDSSNIHYIGNKVYKKGSAKGIIWGGNLATITSLCGLDFIPDNDFIFFTEDINEPVYKIDKMFTQLFNISKFKEKCRGVALGEFISVDNENWMEEYFEELSHKLNIPFTAGFKITHSGEQIIIPIGRNAVLSDNTLVI